MNAELVGVVLAAGSGTRLRPLTLLRPKALCPVGDVPLVDLAMACVRPHVGAVAVNASHGRDQLAAHLDGRAHLSIEEPEALETAGALGQLRPWIDGRDVLAVNVDAHHPRGIDGLLDGWDRQRVRVLVTDDRRRDDFAGLRYTGATLLPWSVVSALSAERHGLYGAVLLPQFQRGRLDLAVSAGPAYDCGTHAEYLAANLALSGGATIVGAGAEVEGVAELSVLWPGTRVMAGERLVEVVRASAEVTVAVGPAWREHLHPADRDIGEETW